MYFLVLFLFNFFYWFFCYKLAAAWWWLTSKLICLHSSGGTIFYILYMLHRQQSYFVFNQRRSVVCLACLYVASGGLINWFSFSLKKIKQIRFHMYFLFSFFSSLCFDNNSGNVLFCKILKVFFFLEKTLPAKFWRSKQIFFWLTHQGKNKLNVYLRCSK